MTTASSIDHNGELAAPLDLLLINSTRSIASRLVPNRSWTRFASSLVGQPRVLAGRGRELAGELTAIALGTSTRSPAKSDGRFKDPAWQGNPLLRRTMQTYLAMSDVTYKLFEDADVSWRDRDKVKFVLDVAVEGLAPSNNPILNPLGWKALIDTGGLSAVRGAKAFVRDMAAAPRVPTMAKSDAFEVGESVAVTPGAVVLKTPMFELIQYTPQTQTVNSIPLLMVPPVINKYYIMDIAPGRSMIEYIVKQGQQVFTISWRNPQARNRDWGLDAYGSAIIEALDAVQAIAGADRAHLMATCSGGILAAMTVAHLVDIGQGDRVAGLTLAVTVLDQTKAGFASAALSEGSATAAIAASERKGYLDGRAMAEIFAWLRPTDLVWRYWVNNYVQGRPPAAFDVLYWNADTTRMAAALHRDLVMMGLHNELVTPGSAHMLGTAVDLSTITVDSYVIGGIADHICPWQAVYRSARLLGSKHSRFALSSSGHIASLVNPPGNKRASFRIGPPDNDTPEEWLRDNGQEQDSWWPNYIEWLAERSGQEIPAPEHLGGHGLPSLGPAPGTYVHQS